MRILFLTQVLPFPLDAGPKARAYYVLRHLAQTHDVTLVSFVRPSDTEESVAHLRQFCANVFTVPMQRSRWRDAKHLVRSFFSGRPFIIQRDWLAGMMSMIAHVAIQHGPFDAIHGDQLWMAPYALKAKKLENNNSGQPLTTLDQHNAVFMIPQRLLEGERNWIKRAVLGLEVRKLVRYEVQVCGEFDHVVWVTEEDYEAVQTQARQRQTQVPNSAVIPICTDPETEPVVKRRSDARRVTFLGGLHYPPNAQGVLWFAEQVFPLVLAEAAEAVLTVIGKEPPNALHRLGIPSQNLDVTGYVEDPGPYLQETAAFIVPLLAGGGMRVKILDAWTWGIPIVSTTVGAEGIDICSGEDILIADDPQHFAQQVVRLLYDSALSTQVTQAGRKAVLGKYNWRTRYDAWDVIYR